MAINEICPICNNEMVIINKETNTARKCDCLIAYERRQLLVKTGIPANYLDKTLDNFEIKNKNEGKYIADFKYYIENFKDQGLNKGRGFILLGKNKRIGKTHCAAAIARSIMEHYCNEHEETGWVLFVNVSNLFNLLWKRINMGKRKEIDESEFERITSMFDRINQCKLLILDDLGVTPPSLFVTNTLYTIIEERLSNNRPIIVTTNYGLEELEEIYGEDGERIITRLNEKCLALKFTGKKDGGK